MHRGLLPAGLIAALALLAFPVAAQAGILASSPPSSSYNTQPYFFGQQGNNFQVSNSGTDTNLGNATITGPDAARFSFSGDACSGFTLGDAHFCHVEISFTPPNSPGSFSAQLEIPSDGSPNPLVIPLSAEALAGAVLAATPPRVDFGDTTLGTSRSQQLTITNYGDFTGVVQQAFVVGPAEFTIGDDQCTQQQLDPGQSCTLTALFTPTVIEDFAGSIFSISGNTPVPVLPINLSGKGRLAAGPAPNTQLMQKPKSRTRRRTASFQFTSSTAGASFECKLDNEAFAPCTSPSTYLVHKGRHRFQVRAKDATGDVDATPAKNSWKVTKKK